MQNRGGAVVVNREIVDHGFHRKRDGMLQLPFRFVHDGRDPFLRGGLAVRVEEETHASASHAAEHPEAPEIGAEVFTRSIDQCLRVEIAGPGDDVLNGAVEIALRAIADGCDTAGAQMPEHLV